MFKKLMQIAKRIGVDVIEVDTEENEGCYLPEYDAIYICCHLSDRRKVYVLAHEITHALKHKGYFYEYQKSKKAHSKMEFEAEVSAIQFLIEHFDQLENLEPDQINFIRFMEFYDIDFKQEFVVKELLAGYYFSGSYA